MTRSSKWRGLWQDKCYAWSARVGWFGLDGTVVLPRGKFQKWRQSLRIKVYILGAIEVVEDRKDVYLHFKLRNGDRHMPIGHVRKRRSKPLALTPRLGTTYRLQVVGAEIFSRRVGKGRIGEG